MPEKRSTRDGLGICKAGVRFPSILADIGPLSFASLKMPGAFASGTDKAQQVELFLKSDASAPDGKCPLQEEGAGGRGAGGACDGLGMGGGGKGRSRMVVKCTGLHVISFINLEKFGVSMLNPKLFREAEP